jgi:septal ring factor EnvC (AmiA/AmiB activator)
MSRADRALIVLLVASLGVWGCARGPGSGTANTERIRALETKIAKLEDDFRAAVSGREQLRKKLSTVEAEHGQQSEQLQAVIKERDELRQQLALRTSERDATQVKFEQFRKGIRTLLGQAEPTTGPSSPPVTTAVADPGSGKS